MVSIDIKNLVSLINIILMDIMDLHKQINKNKTNPFSDKYSDLPFVSIVVPARNEEKYIERCIISLLDQDYPGFEIIVIDDNSTDATSKILKNILDNTQNKVVASRDIRPTQHVKYR